MKQETTDKMKRGSVLILCCLFYLFWLLIDGYTVSPDTQGYIMFAMSREPLYPSFLALFRWIFGTENYFYWVAAAQCILTGYAAWKITDVLTRQFRLDMFSSMIVLMIQIAVNMVNRFLSVKKTLYCLEIQTEGIAIPIFILFLVQLFLYALSQKTRNLIGTIVFAALLISTRKQMYVVLVMMALTAAFLLCLKRIRWKQFAFLFVATVLTLLLTKVVDRGYNFLVRGEAVEHTTDSSTLLNTCFFVAQSSDSDSFKNPELKALFLDMVEQIENQGWGYNSASGNWYELRNFYSDNYDKIAFDVINPTIARFVEQKGYVDDVEKRLAFDEVAGQLLHVMIVQQLPKKIQVFTANAIIGFANTIAKNHPFLIGVAGVFYLMFVITYIIQYHVAHQSELDILMGITCISIITNVGIVSVLIFAQSRYMIYNMPVFYTTFFLLLRQVIWRTKR